jgi:hypothetical protein
VNKEVKEWVWNERDFWRSMFYGRQETQRALDLLEGSQRDHGVGAEYRTQIISQIRRRNTTQTRKIRHKNTNCWWQRTKLQMGLSLPCKHQIE